MPPELLSASPRLDLVCLRRPAVLCLGVLLLVTSSVFPQDKMVASEFDPGVNIQIDLRGRFKYDIYTERNKSEDLEAGTWNVGGGASVRLKPFFKTFLDDLDEDKNHLLVIRLGYEYSRAAEAEETKITHTIMADFTPRFRFSGRVLMSDRSRFELRWVEGDPSFRYRNKLKFERPLSFFRKTIAPYATAEAYWDSRHSSWNKFRYGVGVEARLFNLPVLRNSSLDFTYERERCTTCPDPHTNIWVAKLNIFLKRKK